jgi:hypothetical protein
VAERGADRLDDLVVEQALLGGELDVGTVVRGGPGEELGQPFDRDVGLAVVGAEAAGPPGERREDGDVRGEEAEVADREVAPTDGRCDQEHRDADPGVRGDAGQRVHEVGADLVAPRRGGAGVSEGGEPVLDRRLGPGRLHRGDGAEGVADEPGHGRGRLAGRAAPLAQLRGQPVAQQQDHQDRECDGGRRPGVDAEHDDEGGRRRDDGAAEVEPHVEDHGQVLHVVAEAAHRLAG